MGQILHGRARTTAEIRREIQQSEKSAPILAKRYNINRKTVYKWRHRETVLDRNAGPTTPRSTVLSSVEEAIIVVITPKIETYHFRVLLYKLSKSGRTHNEEITLYRNTDREDSERSRSGSSYQGRLL